jgi:hypothetical protein
MQIRWRVTHTHTQKYKTRVLFSCF